IRSSHGCGRRGHSSIPGICSKMLRAIQTSALCAGRARSLSRCRPAFSGACELDRLLGAARHAKPTRLAGVGTHGERLLVAAKERLDAAPRRERAPLVAVELVNFEHVVGADFDAVFLALALVAIDDGDQAGAFAIGRHRRLASMRSMRARASSKTSRTAWTTPASPWACTTALSAALASLRAGPTISEACGSRKTLQSRRLPARAHTSSASSRLTDCARRPSAVRR